MAGGSRRTGGEGWSLDEACPRCGQGRDRCRCRVPAAAPGKPVIRLRMEKRRGKPVTVLSPSGVEEAALAALLKELKAACGVGGTLKEGEMELQGEHRERLRELLSGRGYTVKG